MKRLGSFFFIFILPIIIKFILFSLFAILRISEIFFRDSLVETDNICLFLLFFFKIFSLKLLDSEFFFIFIIFGIIIIFFLIFLILSPKSFFVCKDGTIIFLNLFIKKKIKIYIFLFNIF